MTTEGTRTSRHSNHIKDTQDPQSHGPDVPSFSARLQAATAVHGILFDHWIPHAFIGGFAFNLLGTTRSTMNIDVIIEDSGFSIRTARSFSTTPNTGQRFLEPIQRIRQLLVTMDERFSLVGSEMKPKLIFTATQMSEEDGTETKVVIPVEILQAGTLGLPRYLNQSLEVSGVPVLAPRFLLLTKMKRCANLIESGRPKSVERFKADEGDIKWLLKRLAEVKEVVDFEGYLFAGTDPDTRDGRDSYADRRKAREDLCQKVGELVRYWRTKGGEKEQKAVKNLRKVVRDRDDWLEVIRKTEFSVYWDGKFI